MLKFFLKITKQLKNNFYNQYATLKPKDGVNPFIYIRY
jgi:hypothetical protein